MDNEHLIAYNYSDDDDEDFMLWKRINEFTHSSDTVSNSYHDDFQNKNPK